MTSKHNALGVVHIAVEPRKAGVSQRHCAGHRALKRHERCDLYCASLQQ
jgi:hypothetical protein